VKEGPDPIVHLRIDHQMNPGARATVDHAMPKAHVDVVAEAFLELQALTFEEEFHVRAGMDGYVDSDFAIFEAEGVVAVFADKGAGSETKKADRLQRTFETGEDALNGRTGLDEGSVDKHGGSDSVRAQIARGACSGAEGDASPIASVISLVIVRNPVGGWDSGEVRLERGGFELKR
jgi:hypothetical protein